MYFLDVPHHLSCEFDQEGLHCSNTQWSRGFDATDRALGETKCFKTLDCFFFFFKHEILFLICCQFFICFHSFFISTKFWSHIFCPVVGCMWCKGAGHRSDCWADRTRTRRHICSCLGQSGASGGIKSRHRKIAKATEQKLKPAGNIKEDILMSCMLHDLFWLCGYQRQSFGPNLVNLVICNHCSILQKYIPDLLILVCSAGTNLEIPSQFYIIWEIIYFSALF